MTGQTTAAIVKQKLTWSRYKFPESLWSFSTILAVLVFLAYSLPFLKIDVLMMLGALGKLGGVVAARFYPPELTYVIGLVLCLECLAAPCDLFPYRSPGCYLLPRHPRDYLDDTLCLSPRFWNACWGQRFDDVLHRVCRQAFLR